MKINTFIAIVQQEYITFIDYSGKNIQSFVAVVLYN